ncbi:hypothetical protein [Actinacidiphila sp. ITFR-21]|nr:hypothetical protein [Streptomyces sp. ITFR-21]WNI20360.1 hypothetical protein RLT57_32675 [Streptomyces sp. ITFR-21]
MSDTTPVDKDLTASPVELMERAQADREQHRPVEAQQADNRAVLSGLRR